jgi:hypothetical protein
VWFKNNPFFAPIAQGSTEDRKEEIMEMAIAKRVQGNGKKRTRL